MVTRKLIHLRYYFILSLCLFTGFIDLLKQLWAADTKGAVTPRNFKSQIQKFSPRFGGYE